MELLGDQKVLAYWLAGIVENQSFVRTIYHKPRVRASHCGAIHSH
jgi:hypothetical protein